MSNLINKTAKQISASKKEITFNLQKYINEIIVIKYGGSAMLDKKLSLNFFQNIKALVELDIKPIIVHGGGPQINLMLDKVNIKHKFFKDDLSTWQFNSHKYPQQLIRWQYFTFREQIEIEELYYLYLT